MLVHAVLVLFMHSLLVAFFFLDSSVHGAAVLIAALVAIWVAFVVSMWWGISMWDFVRCRWRPQQREEGIGGVGTNSELRQSLLVSMRDSQRMRDERRSPVDNFLVVLCFAAVVGFGVWGLLSLHLGS